MRGRKPALETLTDAAFELGGELPRCPPHLDAEAKREWRRIVPRLGTLGILSRLDTAALAAYCQCWSRWVEAETKLRETGLVVKTPQGFAQANPYLSIARQALADMRRFLSEFGLTPVSRHRLLRDAEEPDDYPILSETPDDADSQAA